MISMGLLINDNGGWHLIIFGSVEKGTGPNGHGHFGICCCNSVARVNRFSLFRHDCLLEKPKSIATPLVSEYFSIQPWRY